jgi:arginine decarboxylase
MDGIKQWSIDEARKTYSIEHWSGGYFDVDVQGRVVARPSSVRGSATIDLFQLTQTLSSQGLTPPVLVRFVDILRDRVAGLHRAFTEAKASIGYEGGYTPVYPIKVNQQRSVVHGILSHGEGQVGLEAGSKPELMAVLALAGEQHRLIVCNGYKDREYIRLALVGLLLGHQVYIVVEKLSELDLVIEEARALDVDPLVGVRVRLASIGKGKWQNTGGEKAKFGFSASQLLAVVERLDRFGMLDAFQMLHYHLGSQVANIRDIQCGMREAARYYAELHRMGVNIRCVDVGGGLGIDYEGTRSRSYCSMNYSVQEYANNVIQTLWEVCDEHSLPHPAVVSESGRAMTAHHAVLVTNVIEVEEAPQLTVEADSLGALPHVIENLVAGLRDASSRSALEAYHDATHWLASAQDMYVNGVLTMELRALAEQLYFNTCRKVRGLLQSSSRAHRDVLDELNEKLADKYFCNFSIFQSIPDVWAINQIFPIMPLHRLDQPPERRGVIKDITCDSDGRIDLYVDREGVETSLPLHAPNSSEPYLLGFFLVGAYQEILGDMHNLFGDTHAVNVEVDGDGSYRLTQPQSGDTVNSVLRYVTYSAEELLRQLRAKTADAALDEDRRRLCIETLEAGLEGYTYLED